MKPTQYSLSAVLSAFVLASGPVLSDAHAEVLTQIDFESMATGPGVLTDAGAFTAFAFSLSSDLTLSSPSLDGDKLQGVIATGGDKSGYLGGQGTDLTFTGSGGPMIAGLYPGLFDQPLAFFPGTDRSLLTVSLDFSVQRVSSVNQQTFSIYLFDARDATDFDTFANHSYINIGTDNRVYVQDYFFDGVSSPWVDTGVTILSGREYHASITVDYDADTWSATMDDLISGTKYVLAADRSTNGGGYELSGWTDANGGFDVQMFAGFVNDANKAFADSITFDNLTASAVPEPSTFAAWAGLGVLALGAARRRRR